MRTTLDIDKDVLEAAKELARRQNRSAGKVVSQILRSVLTGQAALAKEDTVSEAPSVAGFRPFPAGRAVVTNETINRLRETEGI
jgi:hypothetical protein